MRKQLCDALIARSSDLKMIFLTGDLGFMALEPLQKCMAHRFINAGVAEQNMVSVAAAMAREGLAPWVYSIAPFCYARPFEQIRNDVAFHNLPVKLIGNGGGYGYGVMGPTHHAIEDYGVLLTLPNFRAYVPVFDEDIEALLQSAGNSPLPCYIRLGRGETPAGYQVPIYAPWRQLTSGGGPIVIVAGPLAGTYIEGFLGMPEASRPNLWIVTELPIDSNPPPEMLVKQISKIGHVCVVEEHVKRGGLGSEVALWLLEQQLVLKSFQHLYAKSHHYSTYGSQGFLRAKSGIDAKSVMLMVQNSMAAF
jgi:transketolase